MSVKQKMGLIQYLYRANTSLKEMDQISNKTCQILDPITNAKDFNWN